MGMESNKAFDELIDVGQLALGCNTSKQFKERVLPGVSRLFGSNGGDVAFADWEHVLSGKRGWQESDIFFTGALADYSSFYLHEIRKRDPVFLWLKQGRFTRSRSVTRLSSLVSDKKLHRDPLVRNLLDPIGRPHVLTLALNRGRDLLANISLVAAPGQGDFTQQDEAMAATLVPMLSGVYQALKEKEEKLALEDVVNTLSYAPPDRGTVIFSDEFDLVFHTAGSAGLLSAENASEGVAILRALSSSKLFKKYLDDFARAGSLTRANLPVKLVDMIVNTAGESLRVELNRVRRSDGKDYLFVEVESLGKAEDPTAQKFGLTLRELQITELMVKGATSAEAGDKLCISPWTVKNHLKKIYEKTGVSSRLELARRLGEIR